MQRYFDAIHTMDPDVLRGYLHPTATIKGVGPDGEMTSRNAADFLDGIALGTPIGQPATPCIDPAVLELDRVLSLEQTSRTTILAKVQMATPQGRDGKPALFVDFLSLLRVGEEWHIVSKIFSTLPIDAPSGGYGYRRQGGCSDLAGVAGAVATEPWEVTAIASALQQYLDGCHCDVSALRTIFHPSAQLKGVNKEGELEVVSSEKFFERVEARRANMHAEDVGRPSELDKILRIDRGGLRAAAATVQVAISGGVDNDVLYTDHLSLLKLGGWG